MALAIIAALNTALLLDDCVRMMRAMVIEEPVGKIVVCPRISESVSSSGCSVFQR